ncbi:MAG: class C beta-lactamase-related serine hydrolase [Halomonadaceae bacterium]|nr:MAG: class C beta-lactamase-related serine hydrolase [Halomonadaceae bacterium]
MGKLLLWGLALLLLLTLALGLLASRPWSDYSPLTMVNLFDEELREDNFRNMQRIFPYHSIRAGDQPHAFSRRQGELIETYEFAGETRTLADFMARTRTTGLLVIQDGAIVHEEYALGAQEHDRFTSWSVAKSFIGTLVGIAQQEGRLDDLDQPISDRVPALEGTGYDGVPIRHVLQMASGVDFDEIYHQQFSDINLFFWKVFVFGRQAAGIMADYASGGASGETFHYISINTQALAMLLEAIYEQPIPALIEEKLWQPLGMEGDAYWSVDRNQDDAGVIAFCCLNAQLRDYARLGQLYLQQGKWQGQQLLPPRWVQQATTPAADFLQPGASPYNYGGRGYQYHWWVPEQADREYFAAGVWGQYIYVSEPANLVIVRTGADPGYHRNTDESIAVFRAIRDGLR